MSPSLIRCKASLELQRTWSGVQVPGDLGASVPPRLVGAGGLPFRGFGGLGGLGGEILGIGGGGPAIVRICFSPSGLGVAGGFSGCGGRRGGLGEGLGVGRRGCGIRGIPGSGERAPHTRQAPRTDLSVKISLQTSAFVTTRSLRTPAINPTLLLGRRPEVAPNGAVRSTLARWPMN